MLHLIKSFQENKEIFNTFKNFPPKKQKQITNAILAATYVAIEYAPKFEGLYKIIKENPKKYAFLPYVVMFVCIHQFRMLYMVLNIEVGKKYLKNKKNDIDITDLENRVKLLSTSLRELNYKRHTRNNKNTLDNEVEFINKMDLD